MSETKRRHLRLTLEQENLHVTQPRAPRIPSSSDRGKDKPISTSIRLELDVVNVLEKARHTAGLTAGEYVIQALEATVPDGTLTAELHPRGTVGGTLFARRDIEGPRTDTTEPPKTRAVGMRFLPADLEVLDNLVAEYAAGSRPKLINAAVRAHSKTTTPPADEGDVQ